MVNFSTKEHKFICGIYINKPCTLFRIPPCLFAWPVFGAVHTPVACPVNSEYHFAPPLRNRFLLNVVEQTADALRRGFMGESLCIYLGGFKGTVAEGFGDGLHIHVVLKKYG